MIEIILLLSALSLLIMILVRLRKLEKLARRAMRDYGNATESIDKRLRELWEEQDYSSQE